ncbi:extracellular solute-binding protein [Streptomyces sp. SL13]|uniref:Extracellular solute-binding protein n=1 Tax=Streptantibioticus silvisoli TaxID=2705255 RepID=A0AA90KAS5_9ACTN|nr:extracellular solute-binding protein [Streptantibioticus silvisoli]MDI5972763.1 extracellular solute-binding protein [Streptantibioticus silvisoli]
MFRRTALALVALGLVAATSSCARSGPDPAVADTSRGPITVWLSDNAQEIGWGNAMVADWNRQHPDQKVTARQIPAGKTSEEAESASIIAGNSACLVFNGSPASVPQFQQQAGLVALNTFPGAAAYITARTGARAAQYESADGEFYQMPWKTNPVMILYNKKIFAKAGIDPDHPDLTTYARFVAASKKIVSSGAAPSAIWPSPASDFFQPWYDYYPAFIAQSHGQPLVKDGKPQFDSPAGRAAMDFWNTLYRDKLAPQEAYPGDAMAEGRTAMATVGPWAIAAYQGKVDWGVMPVPTQNGMPADQVHTFSDEKSVDMFTACKNRLTAWDVLKFATSEQQDGKLLSATGQMPMRTNLLGTYASWFARNAGYRPFADAASRTVEVPDVAGSIDMWQEFRDDYSRSVIFGKQSPDAALHEASVKISKILAEY